MTAKYLKRFFRQLWQLCFTDKPFKITSFNNLFPGDTAMPLDLAETTSGILIKETGALISYPAAPVSLNTPVIFRNIHGRQRYLSSGIFKEPDRYVYSVDNGCVIGPLGLVYSLSQRAFIAESAKEWTYELRFSPYTNLIHYPQKKTLTGITVSCLTNSADGGFYHFLFESIVKLQLLRSIIDSADHILFNGPALEWKIKWLERAGIDTRKIIWVDNTSHYCCRQLIFTSRPINDQQISDWCLSALRSLFNIKDDRAKDVNKRIIWISRKGSNARDILWEDELLSQFDNIDRIDLAKFTVEETIEVMQTATHIIGAHGAGLSNIYLCRPGARVLEIYPDGQSFQPCYQRIATLCSLQHNIVYADFTNAANNDIGLAAFKNILTKFICES